jgi:hypothetical protein
MSQAEMPLAAAVLAAMIALPAAAQVCADPASELGAAFSSAQAAVALDNTKSIGKVGPQAPLTGDARHPQYQVNSCGSGENQELEIPFVLTLTDVRQLHFAYAGCNSRQEEYDERFYIGEDDYSLVIRTGDRIAGPGNSKVLLRKGNGMFSDLLGNFGKLANAKLVSGETIAVGVVTLPSGLAHPGESGGITVPAALQGLPDNAAPATPKPVFECQYDGARDVSSWMRSTDAVQVPAGPKAVCLSWSIPYCYKVVDADGRELGDGSTCGDENHPEFPNIKAYGL